MHLEMGEGTFSETNKKKKKKWITSEIRRKIETIQEHYLLIAQQSETRETQAKEMTI